jgi:prepilin-type N-terminal cleavage/methylation domain-containing protein
MRHTRQSFEIISIHGNCGRERAFTLTELLVVVAIIGILAALLLPAITLAKQRAQDIRCIANLNQFGRALQTFLADNHGYPTFFARSNSDYPGTWIRQLMRGGFGVSKPKTNYCKLVCGVVLRRDGVSGFRRIRPLFIIVTTRMAC